MSVEKIKLLSAAFCLLLTSVANAHGDYDPGKVSKCYEARDLDCVWRAASNGWPSARTDLGRMHYFGYSVDQDYAEAFAWFRLAAYQGFPLAQFFVGSMYLEGKGVLMQDDKEGLFWLRQAALGGNVDACL